MQRIFRLWQILFFFNRLPVADLAGMNIEYVRKP